MLRRLATIAAALTLAACSNPLYFPTEVTRQVNIDDDRVVPRGPCDDFAPGTRALIPWCVDDQSLSRRF